MICNLPPSSLSNGESEASKVLHAMHEGLRAEGLKPIEAFASTKLEPVTLYEVNSLINSVFQSFNRFSSFFFPCVLYFDNLSFSDARMFTRFRSFYRIYEIEL